MPRLLDLEGPLGNGLVNLEQQSGKGSPALVLRQGQISQPVSRQRRSLGRQLGRGCSAHVDVSGLAMVEQGRAAEEEQAVQRQAAPEQQSRLPQLPSLPDLHRPRPRALGFGAGELTIEEGYRLGMGRAEHAGKFRRAVMPGDPPHLYCGSRAVDHKLRVPTASKLSGTSSLAFALHCDRNVSLWAVAHTYVPIQPPHAQPLLETLAGPIADGGASPRFALPCWVIAHAWVPCAPGQS
ncbi:hypothetical protein VTK73DRAFT_1572 [Phialemonium thermophilum]|uniref:Uncharacterized protein n=1 Tax=Phialemonium thermophilum TaxID=223376 RepID=A0ABR3VTC4_9PEZI